MTDAEAIAIRMAEICKTKSITLNRLSVRSGLRQSTLENIAKGHTKNPTLKTLYHVAAGLNMTVAEFLDFDIMNTVAFDENC